MKSENKAEEVKRAIENALGNSEGKNPEETASLVLQALESHKIFRYHTEGVVGLSSSAGRVLTVLIDDPTMTQRAIAVYLDLSETMVDRTIKSLVAAGLITKTKVNRQNVYKVNRENVLNHIDIRSTYRAIQRLNGAIDVDAEPAGEEEPF